MAETFKYKEFSIPVELAHMTDGGEDTFWSGRRSNPASGQDAVVLELAN